MIMIKHACSLPRATMASMGEKPGGGTRRQWKDPGYPGFNESGKWNAGGGISGYVEGSLLAYSQCFQSLTPRFKSAQARAGTGPGHYEPDKKHAQEPPAWTTPRSPRFQVHTDRARGAPEPGVTSRFYEPFEHDEKAWKGRPSSVFGKSPRSDSTRQSLCKGDYSPRTGLEIGASPRTASSAFKSKADRFGLTPSQKAQTVGCCVARSLQPAACSLQPAACSLLALHPTAHLSLSLSRSLALCCGHRG
eukprot:SAG22_NODE_2195_length_2853_cov_3.813362_4_plen_248_part_00